MDFQKKGKKLDVLIVHDYDSKKYFEAVIQLQNNGKMTSLGLLENSILKKFSRDVLRDKKDFFGQLKKALENLAFRLKVPFVSGKIVILGLPPWDFRMLWYGLLGKKNRLIYHTSWPYWGLNSVPRQYSIFTPIMKKAWDNFIKSGTFETVSISSVSAENFEKEYPTSSVTVIPHVISNAFFEVKAQFSSSDFKLLFVGQLLEQKGVLLFPDILENIADLPVNLTIIGDGKLKPFVEKLSLSQKVCFYGFQESREKLAVACSKHQVLIVPSIKNEKWEELFGIVIVEAMAVGLPVVASDHVGPRSIIEDGQNGFLVPEGDVVTFAQQIRLLHSDQKLWQTMSQNAQQTARQYTLEHVSSLWLKLFER